MSKGLLKFCERESSYHQAIESHCKTEWLKDLMRRELPVLIEEGEEPKKWDERIKKYMAETRGLETPDQQKNRLVDIRNIIKEINPNHPSLEVIGFTTEEWREINAKQEKVGERETKFLENPDGIVEKARGLIESGNWADVVAGLAVVTGRRCAEILQTGEFSYKSQYSLIFTGALKRREETPLEFEIPTLIEAKQVILAVEWLRETINTEGMDNKGINRKYAEPVIKSCDLNFQGLIPPRTDKDNLYTHLFRAVYATIAVHWYCPPKVSELEYRAYIQGHFKFMEGKSSEYRHNIAMERHYFDYKIGNGQGNIDGRLGIKLSQVPVIERFKSFYQVKASKKASKPKQMNLLINQPKEDLLSQIKPTIEWMLENEGSYVSILVGLMAISGRKASELLKSADFKALEGETMAVCYYPTLTQVKYRLPCLIEGEKVLEAIARLRKHDRVKDLLYLSPNEIDNRLKGAISNVMRKYLPFFEQEEMKAFYGEWAEETVIEERKVEDKVEREGLTLTLTLTEEEGKRMIEIVKKKGIIPKTSVEWLLDWAEMGIELAIQYGVASPEELLKKVEKPSQIDREEIKEVRPDGILNPVRKEGAVLSGNPTSLKAPSHLEVVEEIISEVQKHPELKGNKAEIKVNSAIDTIMAFNEEQERKEDKWLINFNVLKDLTRSGQKVIKRVLKAREQEIKAHNQRHGLGDRHNVYKGSITEVIEWHWEG